jgi:hypothetical protein
MSSWYDYYVTQYFYPATAETVNDGSIDVTVPEIPVIQEVPITAEVSVSQTEQQSIVIDKVADQIIERSQSPIPMAPPLLASPVALPSRFTQAMLGELPEEMEDDGSGYQSSPTIELSLPAVNNTSVALESQPRRKKWRGRGQQVKVALKKLDMQWVKKNEAILIVSARNSGKTMIIKDYLKKHTDFKVKVLASPTEGICQEFMDHVDPELTHDDVTPELLKNTLHVCKSARTDPNFSAVMILDNIEIQKLCKDKNFTEIIQNGRHMRLGSLMTQQFPTRLETIDQKKKPESFPPSVRANLDWIFLGRETSMETLNKLYQLYASVFPTFEMFKAVHKRCTKDFGFLVIHQSSRSNKLEDTVFWYRADVN